MNSPKSMFGRSGHNDFVILDLLGKGAGIRHRSRGSRWSIVSLPGTKVRARARTRLSSGTDRPSRVARSIRGPNALLFDPTNPEPARACPILSLGAIQMTRSTNGVRYRATF